MNAVIVFNAQYLLFFEVAAAIVYFFMQSRDRRRAMAVISVVFLPLAYVIAKIASFLYFNPRPFVSEHITPLIAHTADNGFPSDHMLLGGAVAAILFMYNKKLGAAAFVAALIVGASRVYAGIHHGTDILGSIGIVLITAVLVQKYITARAEKTVDRVLRNS